MLPSSRNNSVVNLPFSSKILSSSLWLLYTYDVIPNSSRMNGVPVGIATFGNSCKKLFMLEVSYVVSKEVILLMELLLFSFLRDKASNSAVHPSGSNCHCCN